MPDVALNTDFLSRSAGPTGEQDLRRLISLTREILRNLSYQSIEAAENANADTALNRYMVETDRFIGQCGYAQSLIAYALEDMGIQNAAFATISLKNDEFGHVALTATIPQPDGQTLTYLIDPTFAQFLLPDHVYMQYWENTAFASEERCALQPGHLLTKTEEGHTVLNTLIQDGFIILTPDTARQYIDAFCKGDAGRTPQQCWDFLTNPPPSQNNLWFSRADVKDSLDRVLPHMRQAALPGDLPINTLSSTL